MRERVILFLKGMCMGVADVIPGVSGGTLALVLGVYTEFVDTLRGLHLRWLPLLFTWLRGGRQAAEKEALLASLQTLNLGFLITLVAGIASAIVVGSAIIPSLMEHYPILMRALFFGLILASVYVPVRMIMAAAPGASARSGAAVMVLVGALAGFFVTDPGRAFQGATSEVVLTSRGDTLKDIARRGPSSATTEQIYWAEANAPLREAVSTRAPEVAKELAARHKLASEPVMDKKLLKARSAPYDKVLVPPGTPVSMPQPALWFIFFAGAVAICAMILPGISGSYILLIFGVYFFVLNALKGLLVLLAKGTLPVNHIIYISVFITALVVGILSFARVLSFLLHRFTAPTLGALVGLMLGCLRGIWPFQQTIQGVTRNVSPITQPAEIPGVLAATLAGFGVVVVLTVVGQRLGGAGDVPAEADEPRDANAESAA